MKYEDGFLILNEAEVKWMSVALQAEIDARYEVRYFFSTLAVMKADTTEYLNEVMAKADKGVREESVIEILNDFLLIIDRYVAEAHQAIQQAESFNEISDHRH